MKIKILHIIKSLGRGGAEVLLQETLKLHDKEKYEFHYIYFLPWKNQMVKGLQNAGGVVKNIQASRNISILFSIGQIRKYIKQNKIVLVHCHLPWAGFAGRLLNKTLTPILYTEHNKQERYHWITKIINQFTFNRQTAAIAVSEDVYQSVKKNINPSISIKKIENGVNTDFFLRQESEGKSIRDQYEIPQDAVVIGTVAVFRFQKRMKEWLQVFHKLSYEHPHLYALIVGHGPDDAEMKKYIHEAGLSTKVKMAGLQEEVKPFYAAMDIFMMSSVFEGLPIALLEAMSMECAVVCTDAGGVKEVIRNKEDGFLVDVKKWQELYQPVSLLVNSKDAIKEWGAKARKRVVNDFSMEKMVNQLEEVYDEILLEKQNNS